MGQDRTAILDARARLDAPLQVAANILLDPVVGRG